MRFLTYDRLAAGDLADKVARVRAAIERDERLLDGAMADDLPRAVQREDNGFVENVGVHGWEERVDPPSLPKELWRDEKLSDES